MFHALCISSLCIFPCSSSYTLDLHNFNICSSDQAILATSNNMGTSMCSSVYQQETLGFPRGYPISFKSKRIVAGQFTEYRDFTFVSSDVAKIPRNTRYEFGVYDFATQKVLLLDKARVPRCVISCVSDTSPCASFQPEAVLLSPFKVYTETVAGTKTELPFSAVELWF